MENIITDLTEEEAKTEPAQVPVSTQSVVELSNEDLCRVAGGDGAWT